MADIEVRGVTPDENERYWQVLFTAFSDDLTPERIEDDETWGEQDRKLAAVEDGAIVGTAGAYTFELTLPGGARVGAAGVTAVGVLPTHRRRGILRELMARQLDDVVERGEAVAVLTASEARIYGRFGYGLATRVHEATIDTGAGLEWRVEPATRGRIRFAEPGEIAAVRPGLHDAVRAGRHGELSRPAGWWPMQDRDREHWRDGATRFADVVHETDGVVDGTLRYRVKSGEWTRASVKVVDLFATDPEIEAALVRYATEIDLTSSVALHRPVVDPLRYRLADWRRYKVEYTIDHLYLRLLDVEAVLSARTYGTAGTLVVAVDDPFRPATGGTFRLEVDGDGAAACERTTAEPDLRLDTTTLASTVLGDVAPSVLAAAGRVHGTPAALALADRLLVTPTPPFCTLEF